MEFVNDSDGPSSGGRLGHGTTASDQGMASRTSPDETVRAITNVEMLKALADPTRLALLGALMRGAPRKLRVMSVKELAAELGEPQTKLYRHVKHLEAVGLIRPVSSRMVSGIVEHRYQACQDDLTFGPGLMDDLQASGEFDAMILAAFDVFRRGFVAASRRLKDLPADRPDESYRRPVLSMTESQVPTANVAAFRGRLQELIAELGQPAADSDDTVQVNVLIGFYIPEEPPVSQD